MNDAQRMMEEEDANSQVNYIRDMASRLTATEGETAQTVQQIELPVEFIAPASPDMPLLPTASIFTGSFVSGLGYDFLINAALKRINIGGVKLGVLQFGGSQEDGAFYAGAGAVTLDEDGITILGGANDVNALKYDDGSDNIILGIYSRRVISGPTDGVSSSSISTNPNGSGIASNEIVATTGTATAYVNVEANGGTSTTTATIVAKNISLLTNATGGSVVVNEAGINTDTRVEGDADPNLIFADASTDRVGIGTSTPSTKLHVIGTITADGIAADSIQLDTAGVANPAVEGLISWNPDDGTVNIGLPGGNVVNQVGQELLVPRRVKNTTGSNMTNGQLVYISGGDGNNAYITLAKADAEATSASTIAMLTENINNNAFGYATMFGLVRGTATQPINTVAYSVGTVLYLSPSTAGAFTSTKPVAPNHLVTIGQVFRSHATEGAILVYIQNGYEMSELHDVLISAVADGDTIAYDNAAALWKNRAELKVTSTEVTVNEAGSATVDFRAESDTEANMVFLDASADTLYLGGTTNGVKIGKGGELTLIGTATRFDDLRIEPTARLAGTKTPAFTNWKGGLYLYYFDNAVVASEKELHFQVQLPHSWKEGSTIYPHVHWIPITAGTAGQQVRWGFEYTKAKPGDTFGATTTVYRSVADVGDITVADDHMITDLTAGAGITMTGDTLSTVIICRLFRNSSNVNDNYAGDAGLLYVDIHYEIDSFGSATEYSKEP